MTRFVALLRGINVGGKNSIRMADLSDCFESHGFESVETYIQSGNVVFSAPRTPASELTDRIQSMLSTTFDYPGTVTLRDRRQMQAIVDGSPDGFGDEADVYRYDVIYLLPPLTADEAIRSVEVRDGVDRVWPGKGALYSTRLIERASQSRLSKIASRPEYQRMTIRNWKTTTKILEMMERPG